MRHSEFYTILNNNFQKLSEIYIKTKPGGGIATPEDQELSRAFVLLIHAEMENYFEAVCHAILNKSHEDLKKGNVNKQMVGLIAFNSGAPESYGELLVKKTKKKGEDTADDDKKNAKFLPRKLSDRIAKLVNMHYKNNIENNHGIAAKYLAPMFVPFGLTDEVLDPIFICNLDLFAAKRGLYAHKSRDHDEVKLGSINPNDLLKEAEILIYGDSSYDDNDSTISCISKFDKWAIDKIDKDITISDYYGVPTVSFSRKLMWMIIRIFSKCDKRLRY